MSRAKSAGGPVCCVACGVRLAVRVLNTSFPVKCVRFCHVCGEALSRSPDEKRGMAVGRAASCPGAAPRREGDAVAEVVPLSLEEMWESLKRRLRARGSQSLIRCEPCVSSCWTVQPSSSAHAVDASVVSQFEQISCRKKKELPKPPVLWAWPLDSFRGGEEEEDEEGGKCAPIFVRLGEVKKGLSEVVLEFNTLLASMKARCVRETTMWRQRVSALKAELHQKNADVVSLRERVTHLETKLRGWDERHAQEMQEEGLKLVKEQEWRWRLEQQQQDSLNAAFRALRETLVRE